MQILNFYYRCFIAITAFTPLLWHFSMGRHAAKAIKQEDSIAAGRGQAIN